MLSTLQAVVRASAFIFIASTLSAQAWAAPSKGTNCTYQPRVDDFYFSKLPKEIKGWVRCVGEGFEKRAPNIIFVAQVSHDKKSNEKGISRERLMSWFSAYEGLVVHGEHTTRISSYKQAGVSQRLAQVDSKKENGTMSHLLFTAINPNNSNESLVFIYTDSAHRMKRFSSGITQLRQQFLQPNKLRELATSVSKS